MKKNSVSLFTLNRYEAMPKIGEVVPNHNVFRYVVWIVSIAVFLVPPVSGFAQMPFSEDFSTLDYRDGSPGQTTADWNTGFQQLNLALSPELVGDTFDETSAVEVISGRYTTRALGLADLNGDGALDLIDGVLGPNGVQLNRGDGTFGVRAYTSPSYRNTRGIATGDVDRDGDIDFVVANIARPIQLYINDGTGTYFDIQNVSSNNRNANDVALADIDGDGFLDVIAATTSFQWNKLYLNTADPLVPYGPGGTDGVNLGAGLRESSWHVSTGDLDKDGDIDIVFMNEDAPNPYDGNRAQRNRVLMNRLAQGSPNSFSSSEIEIDGSDDIGFSFAGQLGDMNADGFLDLVVCNIADGQPSKIYFNNGAAGTNANPFTTVAVDFTFAVSPDVPIPCRSVEIADADKDGDLDIFLTSSSTDFRNRVYFNDGTGSTYVAVDVGPPGQSPLVLSDPSNIGAVSQDGVVGDIDNDGDIDWVIGNQSALSSSSPLENNIFRNSGTEGATLAQQLRGKATSLQIDSSGAASVRLSPSPSTGMVGPEFLSQIDYWVSGDAGQTWASVQADGRPVAIGAGNDVRWRADLRSESPAMASGLALFQLDIAENQSGPVLLTPIGSAEVNEDDSVTGLPIVSDFSDPDGDPIRYSIIGLPAGTGLAIDPLTGAIDGTPTNDDSVASPITATVFATDGALTATDTFTLVVINANDPPAITSLPPVANATQDVFYTHSVVAEDPDPNETRLLVFSLSAAPAWLSLTDNFDGSATLSGTPGNADVTAGDSVVVVVSDPSGLTDTQSFQITVDNVNDQPIFVSDPPLTAVQDTAYSYNIVTSDPDNGETAQLAISATSNPGWLTFADNGDGTATLSGTPSNVDVAAMNTVTLLVSDPGGLNDTQTFTISVANVNDAPVFQSIPETNATQDVPYTYLIAATDVDLGDSGSLTISAVAIPGWLTLTDSGAGTATLSGTPSAADVDADNTVSLRVSDQSGLTDTQDFVIIVENRNDRPVFTSMPPVGDALTGATYTYNLSAVDPDAGETSELVFSAPTLPQWLALSDFGDGTAMLSGVPSAVDVTGNNAVELVVVDPAGLSSTQSFVINIRDVNLAPEFASSPVRSATESSEYRHSVRVIDPNSDAVILTAPTLPAWLTLTDNGNGFAILRGTPSGADVGDHQVVLQAEEDAPAAGLVTTQQFVITVTATGDGPTIRVNGEPEMAIFEGWNFDDPGATASDVEDGDLTQMIVVDGFVSTSAPGVYVLTYSVSDSAGNRAQAQRIVRVVSPPEEGGIGSSGPAGLLILFIIALLGRISGGSKRGA